MNKKFKLLVLFVAISSLVATSAFALPVNTLTQFDPTANGNFAGVNAVTGIQDFDWSTSGSLVIEGTLLNSSQGNVDLGTFFADAAVGQTLTFNFHAQARLVSFDGGTTNSAATMTLDKDGTLNGNSGYEVTSVIDGTETAEVKSVNDPTFGTTIVFTSASGTFAYYLDSNSNSDVVTGTGFNDGTSPNNPFLTGTISTASGSFSTSANGQGLSTLTNSIGYYDPLVIQTDPASQGVFLEGSTFLTNIYLASNPVVGSRPLLAMGGVIGAAPYKTKQGDLILNADASSTFTAIPEPGTIVLLGIGLLGVAGVLRKRMA